MSALDLSGVREGFADLALESQAVFRGALEALSRPGRIVECRRAATALALALLDQDTKLWVSARAKRDAPTLRFHTGCALVADAAEADFLLVGEAAELPDLGSLACGTDEAPHRSASVILRVAALAGDGGWKLSGPGIHGIARLRVGGLGAPFVEQWARNGKRFPRGVDLFLCAGDRLCGLPRTTLLEA
jgi:alpha-D-ribose 1-methylphosphonate 5-triphosphate synthase subunit PhnH